MITVNNSFYITGYQTIWKTDGQLNVLINYTYSSGPNYPGLYQTICKLYLNKSSLIIILICKVEKIINLIFLNNREHFE